MATKLQLYNTALRYCKSRKLASLTEDREPLRLLDDVYAVDGIKTCLEEAQWKFATRTLKLDYDTAFTRQYGFLRQFTKPTDWVKTVAVCADEYFRAPLTHYHHEGDYWYSDLNAIYVRYVSDGVDFGNNIGAWPGTFFNYVAAYFANEIVDKLSGGDAKTMASVVKRLDDNKLTAKSKDAWNQPTAFPAPGNWVSSRSRGSRVNNDYGNRGSLIG